MGNKHISNISRKKEDFGLRERGGSKTLTFFKKDSKQYEDNINKIDIQNGKKFSFGIDDGASNEDSTQYTNTDPNSITDKESHNTTPKSKCSHNNIKKKNTQIKLLNNKNNKIYKIIRVIGRGFYSKVYLAECQNVKNAKFAIKAIGKKNIVKGRTIEKIFNEKNILTKLNNKSIITPSPFIIELIETFQDERKLYFVFPYYQFDLFNLMKGGRSKPYLNENLYKFILAQVYLAISFLHGNKVFYRDLKPENIIVNGENGYIKLIDFGLAIDEITEDSQLGEICGTNEYIPPEVIKGEKYNLDFDWWGFGIFMYELFFGYPPFQGKNQKEIFQNILNSKEINFDPEVKISSEAKDLILYLLMKEKDYRIKPENIPYHPFFNGIKFEDLKLLKIPSPLKKLLKNCNSKDIPIVKEFAQKNSKTKVEIDQDILKEF